LARKTEGSGPVNRASYVERLCPFYIKKRQWKEKNISSYTICVPLKVYSGVSEAKVLSVGSI
jgi:hypothetical protein